MEVNPLREDPWVVVFVVLSVVACIVALLALEGGSHGSGIADVEDTSTQLPQLPRDGLNERQSEYSPSSADIWSRVASNDIWIGMTAEEARDTLGDPDEVFRTSPELNALERWAYFDAAVYLYFRSGLLVAIQD